MRSYLSLFRNYANFSGFMKRGAYWTAMVIHELILLLPLVPGIFFLLNKNELLPAALNIADPNSLLSRIYLPWALPLWCFYNLLMVIPLWSAAVRRLHSLPRSGWWLLLGLVPVIGSFILLIWMCQKGDYEEYLHRLKRARRENSLLNASTDTVAAASRPRNGGWFFVVLILLAVPGWFLNRQIRQSGLRETLRTTYQAVRSADLTRFTALFGTGNGQERSGLSLSDLFATPTAPDTEPETGIVILSGTTAAPLSGNPETNSRTDDLPDQTPTVTSPIVIAAQSAAVEIAAETEASLIIPTDTPTPAVEEETPVPTEEETAAVPEVREKDHAQMAAIPGGTFTMGAAAGAIDERPAHEVTLSPYRIDIHEVTNEQYEFCVADGACTAPHERRSLRHESYFGNPLYNNYPVIAVDRAQAQAYCEWVGGRLPTEAEWEYAAKGPEGNNYPWGPSFIAANLNYSGNGDYETLAVNATPGDVSSFGVFNLGGNVSEWVLDRYQENWYSLTTQPIDPTGPAAGNYYVIRGGSAQTGENNARTADRFFALGTSYSLDRGFRCVTAPNSD